jgi:hypothetical protein
MHSIEPKLQHDYHMKDTSGTNILIIILHDIRDTNSILVIFIDLFLSDQILKTRDSKHWKVNKLATGKPTKIPYNKLKNPSTIKKKLRIFI